MKWMKVFFSVNLSLLFVVGVGVLGSFIQRAEKINNYERVSYDLLLENKKLKKQIDDFYFELKKIKNENGILSLKLEDKILRRPASVEPVDPKNDLVELKTYRWDFHQLLISAREYFSKKDYVRSAQYFQTIIKAFPQHAELDDEIIYSAGVAAYESKKYDDWARNSFRKIVTEYATSEHYRSSKLWLGLLDLRTGQKKKFFNVVEEFRKKYRNTKEWNLISGHYYEIYKNLR
ncbi:MAG: hypothetical protein CME61_05600 [Halobacteriovoraceae bacterium]|nr:hypothetical protein [Halobacteriovoraceae bacterium]